MSLAVVKNLCQKYLNSEITVSEYSLMLEHTKPSSNEEENEKVNELIDFAAYTVPGNLTEQDKKDGYKSEKELKQKIKEFLK